MKNTRFYLLALALLLTFVAVAQTVNDEKSISIPLPTDEMREVPPMDKRMTVDSMNVMMLNTLQLNEKQQKKVLKLNKKYADLIEGKIGKKKHSAKGERIPRFGSGGPGRGIGVPGGGMGGPGGMGSHGNDMRGERVGKRGEGGRMDDPGRIPKNEMSQDFLDEIEKKQSSYDKDMKKILSEQQYELYVDIKSHFESQKMLRRYLFTGSPNIIK